MRVRPILPLVAVIVGLLASAPAPPPARARQRDPGGGQAAPSAGGLYYALVIGDEDYDSLPKLGTAARDARAIERVLREYYGFQTRLLVNATRSEIVAALADYGRQLGADASLLVYYAGHGHGDAGKAYWLPSDATREDVSKWINAEEVTNGVRAVPARHVLVVSDSCYSGALSIGLAAPPPRPEERERFLQQMAAGRSRTLLASGGEEPAADDGGDGGHSVFAAALLRGLRKMEGPRFTASELFVGHVLNTVASRTGQIPVYNPLRNSGHVGGDFVFTRIKPPPLPGSCDDEGVKAKLYRTFYDNYKGSPEQQKEAHEPGKAYVSWCERCPDKCDKEVVDYVRKWLAKYEDAVRKFQESQRRRP